MGTKPRTPYYFPRMKKRGAHRRTLYVLWHPSDLRPLMREYDAAVAELAAAAVRALRSVRVMSLEEAAEALVRLGQAGQGSIRALEPDPYLSAWGNAAPPETSECPTWFTWSAFGAAYPDTECQDGLLFDLDSESQPSEPCPMCQSASFFDQQFGGSYVVPTCARCERLLPDGAVLRWHERGRALSASAFCPDCDKRTWTLMRDYADELGDETPEWHAGQAGAEPEAVSRG